MRLDPNTGRQDTIVATRPRREDYVWVDSATLVMGGMVFFLFMALVTAPVFRMVIRL